MSESLTIGALAKAAGVNLETVRFYQRRGLLAEPAKPLGGIRRYGLADMQRVSFIKRAQRLGFTRDEIAALLSLEDGSHCAQAKAVAAGKPAAVRERMAQLRQMERALEQLVQQCDASPPRVRCLLISSLQKAQGASS